MSFRAIFIIHAKPTRDKSKKVAFKRFFPVIEKKCQKSLGIENYKKIPLDFPSLILEELQLLRSNDEFIPKFDSCAREITHPLYRLLDGALYPVIAFKEGHFVYCCVVWNGHENSIEPKPLIDSPGVIFALTMLENMAKFIGNDNVGEDEISQSKLESLHRYISVGFPFGVPTELDINTVLSMASTADSAALPKMKGPSWRPIAYKGKQILNLAISESVRAVQFDHDDYADKCEVYGSVKCKVDVEESPEISLNFIAPVESSVLHHVAYHPTVQYVDDLPLMKSGNSKSGAAVEYETQKLRFCPPYEEFVLFHYKADMSVLDIPVKAFYQMKGDSRKVNIMIQLSLSDKMPNDFEAFEIRIPFYNRGRILDIVCTTSSVNVGVLPDKATLLWSIGSKFPNKSTEASLEMVVNFADANGGIVKPHPYLHKLNSYILISWKMNDFTYSGLKFDIKSVELSPSSKIKVSSTSTFKTVEYKVWNSHGAITDTTFSQ